MNGSILPGYYGIEAGQSAVGDIFKWWVEGVCQGDERLHAQLTAEAAKLKPGQRGLLALDWNNGNRTILVDPRLTGLLLGQTLHTTRAEIYRALIEATAFGARAIIERMQGIRRADRPRRLLRRHRGEEPAAHADLRRRDRLHPMLVAGSPQSLRPRLGDLRRGRGRRRHASFEAAQEKMTSLKESAYTPNPAAKRVYDELYALYRELHDGFGGVPGAKADFPSLMKRLLALRERETAG